MSKRIIVMILTISILMSLITIPVGAKPQAGDSDSAEIILSGTNLESGTNSESDTYYTLTFLNANGEVAGTQYVQEGKIPVAPNDPVKPGYTFEGWSPSIAAPVYKDMTVEPVFKEIVRYNVTVNYINENGEAQFPSVKLSYLSSEEFSKTIISPDASNLGLVADIKSITLTEEDLTAEDKVITVTYRACNVHYEIHHYLETLTGVYELKEEDTYPSVAGELEYGQPKEFAGFHVATIDNPIELKQGEVGVINVYYDRDLNTVNFDTRGGEAAAAVTDKYGTVVTMPLPVRTGYAFKGWHTTAACNDETPIMDDQQIEIPTAAVTTYYAAWEALEVNYTVVYMVENVGFKGDPDINNPDHFYTSSLVYNRTALAGSSVSAIEEDINRDLTAYQLHGDTNANAKDVVVAEYLGTETETVKGDGSTVLRIYFKRCTFTILLDLTETVEEYLDYPLNPSANNRPVSKDKAERLHCYFKYNEGFGPDGASVAMDKILISGFKYGDNLEYIWPSDYTGTFWRDEACTIPAGFVGWRGWNPAGSRTDTRSHRYVAEGLVFKNYNEGTLTADQCEKKWDAAVSESPYAVKVGYWVEQIVIPADAPQNGTGKEIIVPVSEYDRYSGETMDNGAYWLHFTSFEAYMPEFYAWNSATIEGFTIDNAGTEARYAPAYFGSYLTSYWNSVNGKYQLSDTVNHQDDNGNKLFYFLYDRNDYELKFNSVMGNYTIPTYSVPFEAKLSWFETDVLTAGVSTAKDENGVTYVFVGWYDDEEYKNPVDWENDRMPANGLTLYAKWEPQKISITFDLNYEGAPAPKTYQMFPNEFVADQEGFKAVPTRPGYEFVGWFTTMDAQTGTGFYVDQKIGAGLNGKTIYAAWKESETGYTVRYLDAETKETLLKAKIVNGLAIGGEIYERFITIPGYFPDKLDATITQLENSEENNIIVFEYTQSNTTQYQVIHRYKDANGNLVSIVEDPVVTSDERVAVYAGHKDIPFNYYPVVAAKSLTLTNNVEDNKIYFDYEPYPIMQYVVHHYYQTDTAAQTSFDMYPEKEEAAEQSSLLLKGYSYIAERKIEYGYLIEKVFVESEETKEEEKIDRDVYFTTDGEQMNQVIHVYMYYSIERTQVEGSKTWNDANDQDGKRPESITINLLANGQKADSKVVTAADGWSWSFTDLDKFANGQEIVYTITEEKVEGYTTVIDGYNVTNTYTPEKTQVSVEKVWEDNEDQDGIRPDSITVKLFADGKDTGRTVVLNAANGWKANFTDLDMNEGRTKIVYSVKEVEVTGYTSSITGSAEGGYIIVNTVNTHILSANVSLEGIKYMDNEAASGFEFQLILPDGTVQETVVSDAYGKFVFGTLVFDREGTYRYTVKEVLGTNERILYDKTVYALTIEVKLEDEQLKAVVSLQKGDLDYEGQIEFYNESLTEIPNEGPPKTGDSFNRVCLIMIISGVLMIADVALFKKKLSCKKG